MHFTKRQKTAGIISIALGIGLTAVMVLSVKNTSSDIPVPFGFENSSPAVVGSITNIGKKNGITVKKVEFPVGTDSETLSMDSLYLVTVPDDPAIVSVPLDDALNIGASHSVNYFGYKYSSVTASLEKTNKTASLLTEKFPGQFFVSAKARAEDAEHGNTIATFETNNGITMSPTDATVGSAMLVRNSLYFIVVNESTPATLTIRVPSLCGDSNIQTEGADGIIGNTDDETCDDGDFQSGDGCSSVCKIEQGYFCSGTGQNSCTLACGDSNIQTEGADGIIGNADDETCDDGDFQSGDGCSATCAVESGFVCSGEPSSCHAVVCGDGTKEGSEACDDTNTTDGDGCSATCTVESGFACTGSAPSTCAGICGDSLIKGSEACDDGDTSSGDGCSATCTVESGFSCTSEPSSCSTTCGDSICAGTESFSDIQCPGGGGGMCSNPNYCPQDCAVCGNFIIESPVEQCDDGNTVNSDGCSSTCQNE